MSFHDAEVLSLRLDRSGPTLELDVEVFAQQPDARLVRLRFRNVTDLEIGEFNDQNVLFDLRAERGDDDLYDVTLLSSYGLGGYFRCATIEAVPTQADA